MQRRQPEPLCSGCGPSEAIRLGAPYPSIFAAGLAVMSARAWIVLVRSVVDRICRIQCVVSAHAYALISMFTRSLDGRWRPHEGRHSGAVHPLWGPRVAEYDARSDGGHRSGPA